MINKTKFEMNELGKMYNPPHPGEVLKGLYLDGININVTMASKALGVTRQNLSEIVNGHRAISPEMALRLAKAFKTEADMWLNMQKDFDLWRINKEAKNKIKMVKPLV